MLSSIHRHFNLDWQKWDMKEIKEFWIDAFKDVFAYVKKNSPFYQERFMAIDENTISQLEDIGGLPFTTKEDIQKNGDKFRAKPIHEIAQIHVSTGTTGGEAIAIYYTPGDLALNAQITQIEGTPQDLVFVCLPYEMSASGMAFHRSFQEKGCAVFPAGKGGAYSSVERTVALIKKLRPSILITTPTYAAYLFEQAQEIKVDLRENWNLTTLWLGGEGCSLALKKRLERMWGCKAYCHYGSLEIGEIGVECPTGPGYHISVPNIYLEIVDPDTGRVLNEGETGELVVSTLLRRGTPLIRFRTEDIGYVKFGKCECGKALPKFFLKGRKSGQLKINGKQYSPFLIEQYLLGFEEISPWYQLFYNSQDESLEIHLELTPHCSPAGDIAERVQATLRKEIGLTAEVLVVDRYSLPRPKQKLLRVQQKGR